MKKITTIGLLIGLTILFTACAGGSGVYRHHHGHSPWSEARSYLRDGVIVVSDKEPPVEATPLPSGPENMPDMGAPDFGGGDFGGDMGGDW